MNFAIFFIRRPILASVLAIGIVLIGVIAMRSLPVAQYPEIAPPTVQVSTVYPGASAEVVAETVAAPIEQAVVGVENALYMSSQSNSDGTYALTITFELGTNLDTAQVLVQNRVAQAMPTLPAEVSQIGVIVRKRSPDILMVVNFFSPNERYDMLYMSNYVTIQVRDEIARLDGVGDALIFGQADYSMRIWLDPQKMTVRNLAASDVVASLREQNVQVAAGQLGQPPVPPELQFQYTVNVRGRLTTPEEFGAIVVRVGDNGQITRLRDIARVELGARNEDILTFLDGKPSVGLAVFQLPGANALETADRVRAKMNELNARLPDGLDYAIRYDTTPFIAESVREVYKTILIAVALGAVVMLVFLQDWRAAIIPLMAVPVSIIGTFAALAAFGFTINNLTLFGLVLAIGLVVDDAIVVTEAVSLNLSKGMSPHEATEAAMRQVGPAIIAISVVLSSVFIPAAFLPGVTGEFFRQFAVTIAVSSLISLFNSLTLSPAMAALLLKPAGAKKDFLGRGLDAALGWFFRLFTRALRRSTGGYVWAVDKLLRVSVLVLVVYAGLVALTYLGATRIPTGFVPEQDKGYLIVSVQLPDAASLERTRAVLERVDRAARATEGVSNTVGLAGMSIITGAAASNFGTMFVTLEPFDQRHAAGLRSPAVAQKLQRELFVQVPEAMIGVFGPPPLQGLGTAGGFRLIVQDRGNLGLAALQEESEHLARVGMQQGEILQMFSAFRANVPQLYLDIDRAQVKQSGVALGDVFDTVGVFLGGVYVNDFNAFGRTWQVNAQADAPFRMSHDDIRQLRVPNRVTREMMPLGSILSVEEISGPLSITRYNMYPASAINGVQRPGVSSGEIITQMQQLADANLPRGMAFEWTEIMLLQQLAGNTAILVFSLSTLLVFLVLSGLYESWSLPLAVILVVPMCVLFAFAGVEIAGLDINIFTQIGLVVLVGLASKNAILIVEYAKDQQREGMDARRAVIEAARIRLRPILMTSFEFIMGVLPLVLAVGAGAEMRFALGAVVFAGTIGVTFFGIFLTPVFFYVIRKITRKAAAIRSP